MSVSQGIPVGKLDRLVLPNGKNSNHRYRIPYISLVWMFTKILTGSMHDSLRSSTICLTIMTLKLVVGVPISDLLRYEGFPVCLRRRCARRRRILDDKVSGNRKKTNKVVKAVMPERSHKLAVQVCQRSLYELATITRHRDRKERT